MWNQEDALRFQTVTLGGGQGTVQDVQDNVCPRAGWVLSYAANSPGNDQTLSIQIDVAGPGPEGLFFTLVQGFTPGAGGLLFIPWPAFTVTLQSDAALPGVHTWRANYLPVNDIADAAGIPSCVDVVEPVPLGLGGTIKIGGRIGCSDWCVWPDVNTTVLVELFTTINAVQTQLGAWSVGQRAPLPAASQPNFMPMGWQRAPTEGQFSFDITEIGGAPFNGSAVQRFDLRKWGSAGT